MRRTKTKPVKYAYFILENNIPKIKITFPFNHEDLDKVRSLPMRKYVSEGKYWKAPLDINTLELLLKWNWTLDEKLWDYFKSEKQEINKPKEIKINNLKLDLFEYQKQGVSFLEKRNGRGLIADEMGLGKTAQSLAYLGNHVQDRPVLIIVPAVVKINWYREVHKWLDTNDTVEILNGQTPYIIESDIVIINYDILSYWYKYLITLNFKIIITDESHFFKNNKAERTRAVKKLGKRVPKFIALSGTPITNRPIEFYNTIKIIEPLMFPNWMYFVERYCDLQYTPYGKDYSGASNVEELHDKLNNVIMIRRLKKDVLKDLPDKIHSFVPIEINNRSEYDLAEEDFKQWAKNNPDKNNMQKQNRIEAFKQIAVKGKINNCINWIYNFLESDEKLVLFAWHKSVVKELMKEFSKIAVKVDGDVSKDERQDAIDRFQSDDSIKLFIGNYKAAGIGINLTAASNVAFIEIPWTPGELDQAIDRCHRIGQKDTVNVYYLIAEYTVDEYIANLIDEKRKVVDSVLDGKETSYESLITELINKFIN